MSVRVYVRGRHGKLKRVATRTRNSSAIRIRVRSWRRVTAGFSDPTGQRLASPLRDRSTPSDEVCARDLGRPARRRRDLRRRRAQASTRSARAAALAARRRSPPRTRSPRGWTAARNARSSPGRRMTGLVVASTGSNAQRGASRGVDDHRPAGHLAAQARRPARVPEVGPGLERHGQDDRRDAVLETCELGATQVSCAKGIDPGTQSGRVHGPCRRAACRSDSNVSPHINAPAWTTPDPGVDLGLQRRRRVDDPAPPLVEPLAERSSRPAGTAAPRAWTSPRATRAASRR